MTHCNAQHRPSAVLLAVTPRSSVSLEPDDFVVVLGTVETASGKHALAQLATVRGRVLLDAIGEAAVEGFSVESEHTPSTKEGRVDVIRDGHIVRVVSSSVAVAGVR